MLYSEFIEGTQQPDNRWTYSEYDRINRIYNDNEDMSKAEAYKLYQDPDPLTKTLLEDVALWKGLYIEKAAAAVKAQKMIDTQAHTISDLQNKIGEVERAARHIINYVNG